MGKVKLDRIDRKILKELQDDGRITNVDLAERVGISAPPCLRRVRALEENNLILGYHAHLDAASLGYGVTVFAQVGLGNQSENDLNRFIEMVSGWPKVRECYMVAGEADFLLKIVAADWDDYQQFLTKHLTAAPNVSHVKSSLTVKLCKYEPGIPIKTE